MKKDLKEKLSSGNGEFIGFTVLVILILGLVYVITAFIQLSFSLNQLTNAALVSARSVAVCTTLDDAKKQSRLVAESAITSGNLDNIVTQVEFVEEDEKWKPGQHLVITVGADIKTIEPYVTSGTRQKKVVVTIESGVGAGDTIIIPPGNGTDASREFDLRHDHLPTGMVSPYGFPRQSTQRLVQNAWIEAGCVYDEKGFCTLDGRYLIACTKTYGKVGDKVDFYLDDGTLIPCIVIDEKNMSDPGCNKWGHVNGKVVLEFLGKDKIGDNPYHALGFNGRRTVKAVNRGTIFQNDLF